MQKPRAGVSSSSVINITSGELFCVPPLSCSHSLPRPAGCQHLTSGCREPATRLPAPSPDRCWRCAVGCGSEDVRVAALWIPALRPEHRSLEVPPPGPTGPPFPPPSREAGRGDSWWTADSRSPARRQGDQRRGRGEVGADGAEGSCRGRGGRARVWEWPPPTRALAPCPLLSQGSLGPSQAQVRYIGEVTLNPHCTVGPLGLERYHLPWRR